MPAPRGGADMAITLQTAEQEYEKNPDIKREEIAKLKEWMDKQLHLPTLKEVDLIVYYHSCNCSMEFTKTTIDVSFTLRTVLDYFRDRDPLDPKNLAPFRMVVFSLLRESTAAGYRVIYCRLTDLDASKFSLDACVKAFVMVADLVQMEHGTMPGVIVVLDLAGLTFGHLARLSPLGIKKTLYYLQDAFPVRLKGFNFLNTPSFMDKILALMRPFMNKTFASLVRLHPDPSTIYADVPLRLFPSDAGGEFDSLKKIEEDTVSKLKDNRHLLMEEEELRVNEKLRRDPPQSISTAFGVEGSFKKLDID